MDRLRLEQLLTHVLHERACKLRQRPILQVNGANAETHRRIEELERRVFVAHRLSRGIVHDHHAAAVTDHSGGQIKCLCRHHFVRSDM
mgnify:CR=1 FL=1